MVRTVPDRIASAYTSILPHRRIGNRAGAICGRGTMKQEGRRPDYVIRRGVSFHTGRSMRHCNTRRRRMYLYY